VKNLKRAKKALEKQGLNEEATEFNFFPITFVLPTEYSLFVEFFKKNPGTNWIMKPVCHQSVVYEVIPFRCSKIGWNASDDNQMT
jgi:hypothetical protein